MFCFQQLRAAPALREPRVQRRRHSAAMKSLESLVRRRPDPAEFQARQPVGPLLQRRFPAALRRWESMAGRRESGTLASARRPGAESSLFGERCCHRQQEGRSRSPRRPRCWRRRADKREGVLRRPIRRSTGLQPRQSIRPKRRPSTSLDERAASKSPSQWGGTWSSCGKYQGKGPGAYAADGAERRAGPAAYRILQLFGPDQLKFRGSPSRQTVILSNAKDLADRTRFQILRFAQNDD